VHRDSEIRYIVGLGTLGIICLLRVNVMCLHFFSFIFIRQSDSHLSPTEWFASCVVARPVCFDFVHKHVRCYNRLRLANACRGGIGNVNFTKIDDTVVPCLAKAEKIKKIILKQGRTL